MQEQKRSCLTPAEQREVTRFVDKDEDPIKYATLFMLADMLKKEFGVNDPTSPNILKTLGNAIDLFHKSPDTCTWLSLMDSGVISLIGSDSYISYQGDVLEGGYKPQSTDLRFNVTRIIRQAADAVKEARASSTYEPASDLPKSSPPESGQSAQGG